MLRKNICLYLLIGAFLCLNLVQARPDDAAPAAPDADKTNTDAPVAAKTGSAATDGVKPAEKLPQGNDFMGRIFKPVLAIPRGILDAFDNALG